MDLEKAFGPQFKFTSKIIPLLQPDRLGMETPTESTVTPVVSPANPVVSPANPVVYPANPVVSQVEPVSLLTPPNVYLIQIQINRDDCHLVITFLLVFIISFLLSSRKK